MKSKGLNFFTFSMCPFCRPVEFLLKANNIEFDRHHLNLMKGEHHTEEYIKINPLQTVPALVEDGFILFESNTIMRYICNSREVAPNWYPQDPKKRAMVDLYFDWHAQNVNDLFKYTYFKIGYTSIGEEEARKISDETFETFEKVFLNRFKYVATDDEVSIADLALIWHLNGMVKFGYKLPQRSAEYFESLLNIPGVKENLAEYEEEQKTFGF